MMKIGGKVLSPKTHKPSRLGGPSAYEAILILLEKNMCAQRFLTFVRHRSFADNVVRHRRSFVRKNLFMGQKFLKPPTSTKGL
jgi:hypothetical protein